MISRARAEYAELCAKKDSASSSNADATAALAVNEDLVRESATGTGKKLGKGRNWPAKKRGKRQRRYHRSWRKAARKERESYALAEAAGLEQIVAVTCRCLGAPIDNVTQVVKDELLRQAAESKTAARKAWREANYEE